MSATTEHDDEQGQDVSRPLSGMRVVEMGTRLAVSYCGKLLVDAGAEVLKVESAAGGDPRRTEQPAYFTLLSAGKRSLAVDGEVADDERLRTAVATADVVVCDETTDAVLDALKSAGFPPRNLVRVSPYGRGGPLGHAPANDFTLQAEAGVMAIHDDPSGVPVPAGVELSEIMGGTFAAIAATVCELSPPAAVGQEVDVSMFESVTAVITYPWLNERIPNHDPYITPRRVSPGIQAGTDGWVCIGALTGDQWRSTKEMIGAPELEDPMFETVAARSIHHAELDRIVSAWASPRTVDELMSLCEGHRIPCSPVVDLESVAEMPPYASRDAYVKNEHGGFVQPRPPFRFTRGAPSSWAPDPPPALGAHSGFADGAPRAAVAPGDGTTALPLEGLRVADFTGFLAGTLTTELLAFLGADVVKVESPSRPDGFRLMGVARTQPQFWECVSVFNGPNLGKRGVTLDLRSLAGKEIADRLVATSDVVIENSGPRVMEGFGLDFDGVRALRDNVVMVRMPAFGLAGPWRERPGFAFSINALCALADVTGFPDGPPVLTGTAPIDAVAGFHCAFALLAAVRAQRLGAPATCLEVALCDAGSQLSAEALAEGAGTTRRRGTRSRTVAPQGVYRAVDGWVALSVQDDEQWAALATLDGLSGSLDAAHGLDERRAAHDAIDLVLSRWCEERTVEELVQTMREARVAVGRVERGPGLIEHPQLLARGQVFELPHDVTGPLPFLGPPFKREAQPSPPFRRSAPLFGADNEEVLLELGYSEAEIKQLLADNVIASVPMFQG